jgi:hypothetical protein
VTAPVLPAPIRTIFCEWESVTLILTSARPDGLHKTFVHRRNDTWSITRLTGEKITGHILLTGNEMRQFVGFA